jgi:riboflavin biosynthesis pyrimidine reductase
VGVRVVGPGPDGVDLASALRLLRNMGVGSLLVEGGARLITSMLAAGAVDRLIVGMAPRIIGAGTEAVGDLGVTRVRDGLRLGDRTTHVAGNDLLLAWDVLPADGASAAETEPAP